MSPPEPAPPPAGGADAATLAAWAARCDPPVPEAFREHLRDGAPAGEAAPEALLGGARSALRDALQGVGERRGAFRLLAADAWLTYACEAALQGAAPVEELGRVLDAVLAEAEAG